MKCRLFSEEEQERIVAAIRQAEKRTSGEIRAHIQSKCGDDPYRDAAKVFNLLGMENTARRNGVLFFVAHKSRRFAVLGDKGINDVVPDNFWQSTVDEMTPLFRAGRIADALIAGICKVGEALKVYFPHQKDDVNELDDGVSYAE